MNTQLNGISEQEFKEFIECVKNGQIERVEQILKGSNSQVVNLLDQQFSQPALYFAVLANEDQQCQQLVKLLIRHGANINFKDSIHQTVLFYVFRDGKDKCAELLMSHGLNLDEVDTYGQTPLFYAVSENQIEMVKKYSTMDRVNHMDKLAVQTSLYYAAKRGHLQMCKLLIEKGANVTHLDSSNKTAQYFARKAKFIDVAEFLAVELKRCKDVNKFSLGSQSIDESNLEKRKRKEDQKPIRQTYKIVYLNEKGEPHDLTEEEVNQMIKSRPEIEAYLANPDSIPQELIDKSNGDLWEKVAVKILAQCFKLKGSYWFQEPVDPVKFSILDYFDIIKNPMDLGTVRKKITHNSYSSARDFVEDMNLIWSNCYKYNGEVHDISRCAKELQNNFNEYFVTYGLKKYVDDE